MTADHEDRLREAEAAIRARGVEWDIDPSLDRMQALVDFLGAPQRSYPVIHVTGTNGKTSTAHMIDALLRARGLRAGRFTSPHLTSMRERICVDGEPLSAERFADAHAEVLPYVQLTDAHSAVRLSFFEVLTAMAFAVFADTPVDIAVVEVGMGGRWDATNVSDGAVAVVTPISLDHTRYLGDTVASIAGEKAGIIKPGAVAVLAPQPPEAADVLLRRVSAAGATLAREGGEFGVLHRDVAVGGQRLALRGLHGDYDDIYLPLFGAHQAGNAACALAAVEALSSPGTPLDAALVREGFAAVTSPGRLELVRRSPTVILDVAHNPAGMAAAMAALRESFTFSDLVGVIAVMADKDAAGLLGELEPMVGELVVTRNGSPRAMEPSVLAALAAGIFGRDRVHTAARLDDAIDVAVGLADETGGIGPSAAGVLITGSVVTAGEARLLLTSPAATGRTIAG